MKTFNYHLPLLYLAFILIFFQGCDTDIDKTVIQPSNQWNAPKLVTAGDSSEKIISEDEKDNEFKALKWEPSKLSYGTPKYKVEIALSKDFSNAEELIVTSDTEASITNELMNSKIIALQSKAAGEDFEYAAKAQVVFIRVVSYIAAQTDKLALKYGSVKSEPISFTVVPYEIIPPPENKCDEYGFVGLIGDAVIDWDTDYQLGSKSDDEPCVYVGIVDFKVGGFKIRANKDWNGGGNWGSFSFPDGGTAINDGGSGDAKVTAETAGKYKITFDTKTLLVTFEKVGEVVDTSIKDPSEWTLPAITSTDPGPKAFVADDINGDATRVYDEIVWSAVDTGSTKTEAKYTVQLSDKDDFDAADAKISLLGSPQTELSKVITEREINDLILNELGGTEDMEFTFYMRIKVQVGTANNVAYSASVERKITPVKLCPEGVNSVAIIGSAVGGWGDGDEKEMQQDDVNPQLYRLTVTFTESDDNGTMKREFKIRANDAWDLQWGFDELSNPDGFTDGGGGNIAVPQDGDYEVILNYCSGVISIISSPSNCPTTNYTSISIIGPGSEAGDWNTDVPLTQDANNPYLYVIYARLTDADEGFKIRANYEWAIDWSWGALENPPTEFEPKDANNDESNIRLKAGTPAANYKITLNVCTDKIQIKKIE